MFTESLTSQSNPLNLYQGGRRRAVVVGIEMCLWSSINLLFSYLPVSAASLIKLIVFFVQLEIRQIKVMHCTETCFSIGIPNPEPFCQTRVSGLESHQTRVSGRVRVWEDGDRIEAKPQMKFAISSHEIAAK